MSPELPAGLTAEQVKSCCADIYSTDWARLLIGESFHPGGTRLTDRLASLLSLDAGSRVVDVAAGLGTSAIHLARTTGCTVVGADLSAANVEEATRRARAAGVDGRVRFVRGDAERLDLEPGGFDAVICECAFCTFPDKPTAAAGFRRLLRPGGRAGVSDLTRSGPLHPALRGLLAWVACVADAAPVEEYAGHLREVGLEVERMEAYDQSLVDLVAGIRRKLTAARVLSMLKSFDLPGGDLDQARAMARTAIEEIEAGHLGYAIITAVRRA